MTEKANFQFYNTVAPRYIEPLLLKLEQEVWYTVTELVTILRHELDIDGTDVVQRNMDAWAGIGVCETSTEKSTTGKRLLFRMLPLGRYLQEVYSTNNELFYDLIHYFFYSTWQRSLDIKRVRFWVYSQVCDEIWSTAPSDVNSFELASKIQALALETFPNYYPSLSERSIRTGFTWFLKLSPPFMKKTGSKLELASEKRDSCTPQLFHLAVDLLYTQRELSYGTSLNVDDEIIGAISRTCLIDQQRFWEMAERTQMIVKGFEVKNSQWGPTITLNHAPNWIQLPAFDRRARETEAKESDYGTF